MDTKDLLRNSGRGGGMFTWAHFKRGSCQEGREPPSVKRCGVWKLRSEEWLAEGETLAALVKL